MNLAGVQTWIVTWLYFVISAALYYLQYPALLQGQSSSLKDNNQSCSHPTLATNCPFDDKERSLDGE